MTYRHKCGCCWPTCILCYSHSGTIPACSHTRACSSGSERTHPCLHGHTDMGDQARDKALKRGWTKPIRPPLPELDTSYYHVTNPYSGLHFSGSLEDNCRCRSLWCCSTSARDHKRVFLLYIRLCLQWTHTTGAVRGGRASAAGGIDLFGLHEPCVHWCVNCSSQSNLWSLTPTQAGAQAHTFVRRAGN